MASGYESRYLSMTVEVRIEIPVDATIQEPELIEAANRCIDELYMHRVVHGEDAVYLRCYSKVTDCEVSDFV